MPEFYIDLCFLCYNPIKNVLAFISTAALGMLALQQLFWFHQTWEVKTKMERMTDMLDKMRIQNTPPNREF